MDGKSNLVQALAIVRSGNFDHLIGRVEDDQVECKGVPYHLHNDDERFELAKDVTSFANAKGGLILLGVHTVKDEGLSADVIERIAPFGKSVVNISQYKDVLGHWVYPGLQKLNIEWIPSSKKSNVGIVIIEVGNQDSLWRPFVITKTIKDNGKPSSVFFAYTERSLDRSAPMGIHQLHLLLRDGMRVGTSPLETKPLPSTGAHKPQPSNDAEPTQTTPNSKAVTRESGTDNTLTLLKKRTRNATQVAQLADKPVFTLAARPKPLTEIKGLFSSRNEDVVRLLENPPELRASGFGPGAGINSRIVENGEARRTAIEGYKLLEFWRDGAMVFVATGGPDFLSWGSKATDLLRINQLTLIETTALFSKLVNEVLTRFSNPTPTEVSYLLEIRRMTIEKPAILFPDALSTFPHGHHDAPGSEKEVFMTFPVETDTRIVALRLVARIYNWFAFDEDKIPYTEEIAPGMIGISPDQIIRSTKRAM